MVDAAMKHMASNFFKLDKFEGVDFRRWKKKMHFLLSSMSVVCVLTTPIPEDGENATMEQIIRRNKWENDDYVCRGLILNGMSDSLFNIYQNVESSKELWDFLEAKYMADNASSKKFLINETIQDSNKPKSNNGVGASVVNMVEHNNSTMYNDNRGKRKHHDTKADPNKKSKVTYWKRDERSLNNNSFLGEYKCSSLALDKEEMRYEKKRLDHLKQDQTMLVIKRFSERKKVFRERNKTKKIRAKRMVVKEIEDGILEEMEVSHFGKEQDIDDENEDGNENKLAMVNEEGCVEN
ncbi:hypothetical protein Tco_1504582 [Tanacetum coccineum]